jgi:hypothetical protein
VYSLSPDYFSGANGKHGALDLGWCQLSVARK